MKISRSRSYPSCKSEIKNGDDTPISKTIAHKALPSHFSLLLQKFCNRAHEIIPVGSIARNNGAEVSAVNNPSLPSGATDIE